MNTEASTTDMSSVSVEGRLDIAPPASRKLVVVVFDLLDGLATGEKGVVVAVPTSDGAASVASGVGSGVEGDSGVAAVVASGEESLVSSGVDTGGSAVVVISGASVVVGVTWVASSGVVVGFGCSTVGVTTDCGGATGPTPGLSQIPTIS